MQGMADGAKDFISSFRQDIMSGIPPLEAFGKAVSRLSDRLFDELLTAVFKVQRAGSAKSGGGGIIGGILGWIGSLFGGGKIAAFADGGRVVGPGGPKDDRIPILASNGEFIVNAEATRRHSALLAAINAGKVPAFADGGIVNGKAISFAPVARAQAATASPIVINAPVTVNGSSGTPEQNNDLAKRMAREMEATMRGVVANEIQRQMRPGNLLNR